MRALIWTILLTACVPRVERGPAALVEAEAPARVVTLHDDSSPNVYFEAVVAAGSAYDPVGKEGLAALTAHSMLEAGAGERSGQELKKALYPTANEIDVVVDREWTSFRLRCHVDQASLCLGLFADVLTAPRFDEADVTRLRDEAVYEVSEGILGDDEALGEEVLNTWMYEGHPYGHPVTGRAGVLPLLDSAQARQFHADHYVRGSVIAGVAGNYDDELLAGFQARLAALPTTPPPELVLQQPVPVEGRTLVAVDTETGVTGFHLGHPLAMDRNHQDWPALYVGIGTFGVHRQSHGRLFKVLRDDRGLNYGTYAYMEPFVQRGWSPMPEQGVMRRQAMFMLWIRPVSIDNGPFALKIAIDELEKLAAEGLTEEEFEANRSYLAGHMALEAPDPGRRLAYALDAEATGTPNVLEYVPRALASVTLEEVNAALAKYLRPQDLRIVAVSGDAEGLVARLVEQTPTPIVYNDVDPSDEQAARDEEVAAKVLGLAETRVAPAQGIFK